MAMFASDVKLDPTLTTALGSVAASPKGSLQDQYGKLKTRFNAGSAVNGRPASDYNTERMSAGQTLGNGKIDSSLEGVLGDTTYKDALAERDFQQNEAMARRIADLNSPSLLQEVLGGIGGAAGVAGAGASLYKSLGKKGSGISPDYGTASNPFANLNLDAIRGYEEYPSLMRR